MGPVTSEARGNIMKKRNIIALMAALCIAAALLCGCSQVGRNGGDDSGLPALVIGSDEYEPFNYMDENGEFKGIDVELAEEACRRMGYRPVFKRIIWEETNRYLEDDEVACLWGSFTMSDREDQYEWVGPYMYSRQVVAVRADSDIYRLSDLAGKRVAVQATSKPEKIFMEGTDTRIPEIKALYSFSTMDDIYSCLRKNYADAIAGHEGALSSFMSTSPDNYRMLDESLYTSELGVAFEKGKHRNMAERLNDTLNEMKNDGTTAKIVQKYGLNGDYALKGQAAADDVD